jgi:hypothetical protein
MTQETTQQDTSNDTTLAAMSDEDFLNAVATSPVTEPIPTEQAAETPETKEVESVPAETPVEEVPATPTEVPAEDARGTEELPQGTNNPETQEFVKKFNFLSFFQSGLNKTPISSTDVVNPGV